MRQLPGRDSSSTICYWMIKSKPVGHFSSHETVIAIRAGAGAGAGAGCSYTREDDGNIVGSVPKTGRCIMECLSQSGRCF